jgi:hypothetical protein
MADNSKLELVVAVDVDRANASIKRVVSRAWPLGARV